MTELEAWKFVYAWAKKVRASADPQFEEALQVIGKSIRRVEKAHNDQVALSKMVEEALAAQGSVVVWIISAEDVRSLVRSHTGLKKLRAVLR